MMSKARRFIHSRVDVLRGDLGCAGKASEEPSRSAFSNDVVHPLVQYVIANNTHTTTRSDGTMKMEKNMKIYL